jgi:hypothetical protein
LVLCTGRGLKNLWTEAGGNDAWLANTPKERAAYIQGLGYDSVQAYQWGQWVVYQPDQIKAAINSSGAFGPASNAIMTEFLSACTMLSIHGMVSEDDVVSPWLKWRNLLLEGSSCRQGTILFLLTGLRSEQMSIKLNVNNVAAIVDVSPDTPLAPRSVSLDYSVECLSVFNGALATGSDQQE